jgi:hypothetical protein
LPQLSVYMRYCQNIPISVQITDINSQILLDQAFTVGKEFKPTDEQEFAALTSKTEQAAMTGEFEPFKTTSAYDATARRTDWMG